MATKKIEKRNLKCDFTQAEINDLAHKLAEETTRVSALEDEKKAVTSSYKAKIDEGKASTNKYSTLISNGWEIRNVECEIEFHVPKKGHKTVTRTDTGESTVEKMESYEWDLFNQDNETPVNNTASEDLGEIEEVEPSGPKMLGASENIDEADFEEVK